MFDSPATLLYRLQAVDQAVAQRRTRLKEIAGALRENQAVQQATKHVVAATDALKPWQARARDLDLEIKGIIGKLKATTDNLYSGRVTNPKALQDLENEIAALKRHQSKLEDDLLEAMVNSEEGQAQLDTAQNKLNEAQTLYASLQVDLQVEKDRVEGELPALESQRKQGAEIIEPAMLATYEAMRPKKAGHAIALLKEASCMSCGVEQTSNLVRKVQQDHTTLVSCASCGRILAPRA